jgi:hypothetical protein
VQAIIGGRGKAGGIVMADKGTAVAAARDLFTKRIKGLPVREILAEQRLEIQQEYYLSITIDRSTNSPSSSSPKLPSFLLRSWMTPNLWCVFIVKRHTKQTFRVITRIGIHLLVEARVRIDIR